MDNRTFCYVNCKANNYSSSTVDETGCFIGNFAKQPISPVMPSLLALYEWMKQNEWRFIPNSWEVTKNEC